MISFPGLQDYFEKDDVLFEANPWAIVKTDKLAGYMAQIAVIGHKCDRFDVVQFLDEEDCLLGVCWWCKESIPDEIQGMWKMLNWNQIPKMKQYETDEVLDALPPHKRFVKNHPKTGYSDYKLSTNKSSWVGLPNPFQAPEKGTAIWHPSKKKTQSRTGRYSAP